MKFRFCLLVLFIVMFLFSCKKEDETTDRRNFLKDGEWKMISYTINGNDAMDTITKYNVSKDIVFHKNDNIEVTKINYWIHTYRDEGACSYLGFQWSKDKCLFKLCNPDSAIQRKTNTIIPPISNFYWNVDVLEERGLKLSCYYKDLIIKLQFSKNQ